MIKLSEFMTGVIDGESELDIIEKIVRKKVIRGGKLKKIKRSNKDGYGSSGGKEKKISTADHIKKSKTQKRASKKRAGKSAVSDIKRKKSMRKRKSMGI